MSTHALATTNGSALSSRANMPPGLAINGLDDVLRIAKILSASGFFADAKSEAQAAAKILRGWELGIAPFAALETVYVIKGKTALAAHMIAALIKKSGRYNYRVKTNSNQECTIVFFEAGESVGEYSYTIGDAATAGLSSGEVWKKYPKAMLYSRCISAGAKMFCPDVFGGAVYVPEELGAEVDSEGQVLSIPVEVIQPQAIAPANVNGQRIKSLCQLLDIESVATYKRAASVVGGKASRDLTAEELALVEAEILAQWGNDQGAFGAITHARNAFNKLFPDGVDSMPGEELVSQWASEVARRCSEAQPAIETEVMA